MTAYLSGLSTGAGLIIAIGAQNAYVLTQGVRKNHHLKVALLCSLFDIFFIMTGVAGVGSFIASSRILTQAAAWGGAAFLFWYGFRSLRSAFRQNSLVVGAEIDTDVRKVLLAVCAVTLLNPHMYLDTVVLVGSISAKFGDAGRYLFGLGASTASVLWFFSLVLFGSFLSKFFSKPSVWRVLDISVCGIMWSIAVKLVA